jgi:serine/threonine protein kinase
MPASDYRRHELLGEGTFGKVYKGEVVATGRAVAIKKLLKVSSRKEGVELATLREIMLLHELVHENVIELVEVLCAHGGISLVFEYCVTDLEAIVERLGCGFDRQRLDQELYGAASPSP